MRRPKYDDFDNGDGTYDFDGFDEAMGDFTDSEREKEFEEKLNQQPKKQKTGKNMKPVAIVCTAKFDPETRAVKRKINIVDAPKDQKKHLQFFYDQIKCKLVEVVYVDGFDVWVDEEGLYVRNSPVFSYGNGINLAGNIVVSKGVDARGGTVWFDQDETDDVEKMGKVVDWLQDGELVGVCD